MSAYGGSLKNLKDLKDNPSELGLESILGALKARSSLGIKDQHSYSVLTRLCSLPSSIGDTLLQRFSDATMSLLSAARSLRLTGLVSSRRAIATAIQSLLRDRASPSASGARAASGFTAPGDGGDGSSKSKPDEQKGRVFPPQPTFMDFQAVRMWPDGVKNGDMDPVARTPLH